jgi:hypothetical protein
LGSHLGGILHRGMGGCNGEAKGLILFGGARLPNGLLPFATVPIACYRRYTAPQGAPGRWPMICHYPGNTCGDLQQFGLALGRNELWVNRGSADVPAQLAFTCTSRRPCENRIAVREPRPTKYADTPPPCHLTNTMDPLWSRISWMARGPSNWFAPVRNRLMAG